MTFNSLSRAYQIIIYVVGLALVIVFSSYFYRQAVITQSDLNASSVASISPRASYTGSVISLNVDFFKMDKFLNLKPQATPAQVFPAGKRNPFEPQ
jgi:hypothetical protein